ncbi:hypothetical protein ACA910_017793 [Epithemia clementina (nom. ined.)]
MQCLWRFSSTAQMVALFTLLAPTPITHALTFQYTHLEVNAMLWQFPEHDISLVIDPLASQLDFGIPAIYRANKKVLTKEQTLDCILQAKPSHCLLSQGLDDHTHPPTLQALSKLLPDLKYICAPSAYEKAKSIVGSGKNVRALAPGQSMNLQSSILTATQGALVGPPWQVRENGWILELDGKRIYMEPHSDVLDETLQSIGSANVVIAPVTEQRLVAYNLVNGPGRTLEICHRLGASTLIPLNNGDVNSDGPLGLLVQATGGVENVKRSAQELHVVSDQQPGKATTITI